MRILSQDGMSDYPYDEVGLSVGCRGDKSEFYIFCHHKLQDDGVKIAIYSTAEKAQRAMEMLRKAYSPLLIIKDLGNGVEADIKPNDWIVNRTEPNGIRENFYFQFPADDEIEV